MVYRMLSSPIQVLTGTDADELYQCDQRRRRLSQTGTVSENKKYELMLTRRANAYSSSGSVY